MDTRWGGEESKSRQQQHRPSRDGDDDAPITFDDDGSGSGWRYGRDRDPKSASRDVGRNDGRVRTRRWFKRRFFVGEEGDCTVRQASSQPARLLRCHLSLAPAHSDGCRTTHLLIKSSPERSR